MYLAKGSPRTDERAGSSSSSSPRASNDGVSPSTIADQRLDDRASDGSAPSTLVADNPHTVPSGQLPYSSPARASWMNPSIRRTTSLPFPAAYLDSPTNPPDHWHLVRSSTDRSNQSTISHLREMQAMLFGSGRSSKVDDPKVWSDQPTSSGAGNRGATQPDRAFHLGPGSSRLVGGERESQQDLKGHSSGFHVSTQTDAIEAAQILERATMNDTRKTKGKGKQTHGDDDDSGSGGSLSVVATGKRKRNPQTPTAQPKIVKTNSRPGRKFEMQWRLGQAPAALMRGAKEQENFERALAAASRYYQGNADGLWRRPVTEKGLELDRKGLTESLAVSVMLVAGLITAGQKENAAAALNKTLPLASQVLLSQHPQVGYWLIETSMDTSPTVAGRLRAALTVYLMSLANKLLGEQHPLSILLNTPLTTEQRVRLRMEAQRVTHAEYVRIFGTYSFSTMQHLWYWARLTASAGHIEESIRMLERLTQSWEQMYSTNSAVALTALVEQARVMLAAGDDSVKVECMLGDALRRNDVLSSGQGVEPQFMDVAEARLRGNGLIYSRLAALRNLGRLHVMRRNFGAAMYYLEQAVAVAEAKLPPDSSVGRLCKTDLEAVKAMELELVMGTLSIEDPTSRLPPSLTIIPLPPMAES